MSASRPRSIVGPALFLGLSCSISVACSGILGLDELPLRPEGDAASAPSATDAATSPPPDASAPAVDAGVDARPPCDTSVLDTDTNNCGACGKVCKSKCTAGVCDADRVGTFPGFPRGIYVAGSSVYFAVAGVTADAKVYSCPVAGPCTTPTVERADVAQNVVLLAARATPALLTFFEYEGAAIQKTSFFACAPGACMAASAFRSEPGPPLVDAIDIDVPSIDHRIAFTTALGGSFTSVTNATPARSFTELANTRFLGHNQMYVWARASANIFRFALDNAALPVTTVPLTDLPSPREIGWVTGMSDAVLPSTNGNIYRCVGPTSSCVPTEACVTTAADARFALDPSNVAYVANGGITLATVGAPCAALKRFAPATPAVATGARSIAIAPSHVLWLEEVNNTTHLYRAAR